MALLTTEQNRIVYITKEGRHTMGMLELDASMIVIAL